MNILRTITDSIGITGFAAYAREIIRGKILLTRLKRRLQRLEEPGTDITGKDSQLAERKSVVVNATRPVRGLPFHLESVIARGTAFKDRADVHVIWDDGVLEHWDTVTRSDVREQRYLEAFGRWYAPRLLRLFDLDDSPYSNFLEAESLSRIRERFGEREISTELVQEPLNITYSGIDIGKYARASTVRYYQRGYIPRTEEAFAYFTKSLVNAALSAELADGLLKSDISPDVVVTSHALYSTWGPFFDRLRAEGIEVVVYGLASSRKGTITLLRNTFLHALGWESMPEPPSVGKHLDKEQARAIGEFLDDRFSHRVGDTVKYREVRGRGPESDQHEVVNCGNSRPTFALFSNVLWDAAVLAGGEGAYENPVDWILDTSGHFLGRSDVRLVVKAHPSELSLMQGQEGVLDLLDRELPEMRDAENITLLAPDTDVGPYELLDHVEVTLVFNGTIGLEAACKGHPVIAAARPHYGHCVLTPEDQGEYFDFVDRVNELQEYADANRDCALRHAYWYFLELPFQIPFADEEIWGRMDMRQLESVEDLSPECNPDIGAIVDFVLGSQDHSARRLLEFPLPENRSDA